MPTPAASIGTTAAPDIEGRNNKEIPARKKGLPWVRATHYSRARDQEPASPMGDHGAQRSAEGLAKPPQTVKELETLPRVRAHAATAPE